MGVFVNHLVFSRARGYRLTRHALFWLFSLGIFVNMDSAFTGSKVASLKAGLTFLPLEMLYIYVILYWLVPRTLMHSAYVAFCLRFIGWIAVNLLLDYFWRYYLIDHTSFTYSWPRPPLSLAYRYIFDANVITVSNVTAGVGIWITLYRYWQGEVWQKMQLRQEKTKAELELLKAQLHPHFLFNTLNNLYALVIEQSEKAPQMLMRLSAILSYVLYECRAAEVPVERELMICKDYIELERERYGERLDVSVDFSGSIDGKMVSPMLFQPFIENAFRLGASEQEGKVWMSVELSVRHHQLFFRVINSANFDDARSGLDAEWVGVQNIVRRLELLYPGRHQLTREKGDGVYIVSLTIDLSQSAAAIPEKAGLKKEPALYENAVFNY
jgi:two-component system, LytTR family, sensor histidine kinase AlgZ